MRRGEWMNVVECVKARASRRSGALRAARWASLPIVCAFGVSCVIPEPTPLRPDAGDPEPPIDEPPGSDCEVLLNGQTLVAGASLDDFLLGDTLTLTPTGACGPD